MVDQFNGLLKALGKVGGMKVLRTSEAIEDARVSLPCAVIDFEPCAFEPYGENASLFTITPSFSIELHVARSPHKREEEIDQLIALFRKVLIQILKAFPQGLAIKDTYVSPAVLGNQETFAFAMLIELRKMKFNLLDQ